MVYWIFLLKALGFHKWPHICRWLSKTVFSRGSMAESGRASSWAMAKSTAITEVCVHTQVAKTPPGSLDVALGHTASSEALLSMDGCQLVGQGEYGEGCLIQPRRCTEWEPCHPASSWVITNCVNCNHIRVQDLQIPFFVNIFCQISDSSC